MQSKFDGLISNFNGFFRSIFSSEAMLPCICYRGRLVVMVDQEAFYCSTGENSGLPGTWLPFIVCAEFGGFEPEHIPQPFAPLAFAVTAYGVLIKFAKDFLLPEVVDLNIEQLNAAIISAMQSNQATKGSEVLAGKGTSTRIMLQKHLIISMQLGGGLWNNAEVKQAAMQAAGLNAQQQQLANSVRQRTQQPIFETDDPSECNHWLVEQGAIHTQNILTVALRDPLNVFNRIGVLSYFAIKPLTRLLKSGNTFAREPYGLWPRLQELHSILIKLAASELEMGIPLCKLSSGKAANMSLRIAKRMCAEFGSGSGVGLFGDESATYQTFHAPLKDLRFETRANPDTVNFVDVQIKQMMDEANLLILNKQSLKTPMIGTAMGVKI